ncbi:MAG TPA: calcium/proton exchanger [Acidimicrobiales bacterium]|nr:calcium/proton exchanger [Acidimicrobiales bacterium]
MSASTVAPSRSERITMGVATALFAVTALSELLGAGEVPRFVVAGLALAALAAAVGQAIEQVGERLGPSATGLLQSTLGNLPELFVGLFALHDGLTRVVQASLAGSILGNALLVLGMAFVAGGLRHGRQRFDPEEPRLNASLLLLAVAALLVPTLAARLDTPAAAHTTVLSDVCAAALLAVYAATIPFSLRRNGAHQPSAMRAWPLRLSLAVLVAASAGSAVVSDWFVGALVPATHSLGISEEFTGLVIVAIASNAVEHAVGIRFALRAKPEFAISTTLNSPLQVALLLVPVLVLASPLVGATLTLVWSPLLIAALAISAVVVLAAVYDGEYTWIEGVALVGLYVIVVAGFWWG